MPDAPASPRRRRFLIVGCLGAPLLALACAVAAFLLSATVRELTFITLLAAPSRSLRAGAANALREYPSEATIAALVATVNAVDRTRDETVAHNALRSLCIVSDHDFGCHYARTPSGWTFGFPVEREWPEVVARVNAWALERAGHALPGPPPGPAAPPVAPRATPEKIRQIIDRIADPDPKTAGGAWNELGASYNNSSAYLADVREFLGDPRPLSFWLQWETYSAPGQPTFTYSTTHLEPIASATSPPMARTVGQALRLHLWAYEDVSHSGFHGTFEEWWKTFSEARQLPAD